MYDNKQRFKSKVVWLSVISLILIILNTFGVFEGIGITETEQKIIVDSFLSILVLFGFLNNPTDKENF